jgi:hypothetical protein
VTENPITNTNPRQDLKERNLIIQLVTNSKLTDPKIIQLQQAFYVTAKFTMPIP